MVSLGGVRLEGGYVWGRVIAHLSEIGLRVWVRSGQVRWELPIRQMTEGGQWDTAQGIR